MFCPLNLLNDPTPLHAGILLQYQLRCLSMSAGRFLATDKKNPRSTSDERDDRPLVQEIHFTFALMVHEN